MLTLNHGSVLVMAAANFSVISLSLVVTDVVYSSSVSSLSQIWVRRSIKLSTVSLYRFIKYSICSLSLAVDNILFDPSLLISLSQTFGCYCIGKTSARKPIYHYSSLNIYFGVLMDIFISKAIFNLLSIEYGI